MTEAQARLVQLEVGGSIEPWRRLGLQFDIDNSCRIGQVNLLIDEHAPSGSLKWAFDRPLATIDGISSGIAHAPSEFVSDDFVRVDHVVVMTDSLERTSSAIVEIARLEQRRVREAGDGVRQAFHRSGEVIIEVVQTRSSVGTSLWGFVLVANNLDDMVERLGGDALSAPKAAVQPDRRIATVRSSVGLGVNVALMSPDQ